LVLRRPLLRKDTLLNQTKGLLRRFNLKARKRLGQHFLIDEGVLQLIVSAADLTPADTVIEVGPGLGILTKELAKQAGLVIAVELDNKLADILKRILASFGNSAIVNKNILDIDPGVLLQEQGVKIPGAASYKMAADLPYYITSPVLRHFLEASLQPEVMIVMVQREVAEAIAAEPGHLSVLSISVQFYGKPRIISLVPSESFYPAPKVDSAILRIDLYSKPPVAVTDEEGFFKLVRAGFSASRKQIANSLAQGLAVTRAEALSLLEEAKIAPQRRAETFALEEWAQLWRVFQARKGK
jgi:16S rRNA (adenine1518-N6/adenine1519-N6)-dimethyltransferase